MNNFNNDTTAKRRVDLQPIRDFMEKVFVERIKEGRESQPVKEYASSKGLNMTIKHSTNKHYLQVCLLLNERNDMDLLAKVYMVLGESKFLEMIVSNQTKMFFRQLIDAIFRFSFDTPIEVIKSYQELLYRIVSGNSIYLLPAINMLIRSFRYDVYENSVENRKLSSGKEEADDDEEANNLKSRVMEMDKKNISETDTIASENRNMESNVMTYNHVSCTQVHENENKEIDEENRICDENFNPSTQAIQSTINPYIHQTLEILLKICPSGDKDVFAVLEEKFPHRLHDKEDIIGFTKECLYMISTYLSGIEQEVVSLLVERCVEIDVEMKIEANGEVHCLFDLSSFVEMQNKKKKKKNGQNQADGFYSALNDEDTGFQEGDDGDSDEEDFAHAMVDDMDQENMEQYESYNNDNNNRIKDYKDKKNIPMTQEETIDKNIHNNLAYSSTILTDFKGDEEEVKDISHHLTIDEMATKLDHMLYLLYNYIRKSILIRGRNVSEILNLFLVPFYKEIFYTHRSKFTQYLLFYITSFDHYYHTLVLRDEKEKSNVIEDKHILHEGDYRSQQDDDQEDQNEEIGHNLISTQFLLSLIRQFNSPSLPTTMKHTIITYLASFTARARFLDASTVEDVLYLLILHAYNYVQPYLQIVNTLEKRKALFNKLISNSLKCKKLYPSFRGTAPYLTHIEESNDGDYSNMRIKKVRSYEVDIIEHLYINNHESENSNTEIVDVSCETEGVLAGVSKCENDNGLINESKCDLSKASSIDLKKGKALPYLNTENIANASFAEQKSSVTGLNTNERKSNASNEFMDLDSKPVSLSLINENTKQRKKRCLSISESSDATSLSTPNTFNTIKKRIKEKIFDPYEMDNETGENGEVPSEGMQHKQSPFSLSQGESELFQISSEEIMETIKLYYFLYHATAIDVEIGERKREDEQVLNGVQNADKVLDGNAALYGFDQLGKETTPSKEEQAPDASNIWVKLEEPWKVDGHNFQLKEELVLEEDGYNVNLAVESKLQEQEIVNSNIKIGNCKDTMNYFIVKNHESLGKDASECREMDEVKNQETEEGSSRLKTIDATKSTVVGSQSNEGEDVEINHHLHYDIVQAIIYIIVFYGASSDEDDANKLNFLFEDCPVDDVDSASEGPKTPFDMLKAILLFPLQPLKLIYPSILQEFEKLIKHFSNKGKVSKLRKQGSVMGDNEENEDNTEANNALKNNNLANYNNDDETVDRQSIYLCLEKEMESLESELRRRSLPLSLISKNKLRSQCHYNAEDESKCRSFLAEVCLQSTYYSQNMENTKVDIKNAENYWSKDEGVVYEFNSSSNHLLSNSTRAHHNIQNSLEELSKWFLVSQSYSLERDIKESPTKLNGRSDRKYHTHEYESSHLEEKKNLLALFVSDFPIRPINHLVKDEGELSNITSRLEKYIQFLNLILIPTETTLRRFINEDMKFGKHKQQQGNNSNAIINEGNSYGMRYDNNNANTNERKQHDYDNRDTSGKEHELFFPYDPYLLFKSHRYVGHESVYRYWTPLEGWNEDDDNYSPSANTSVFLSSRDGNDISYQSDEDMEDDSSFGSSSDSSTSDGSNDSTDTDHSIISDSYSSSESFNRNSGEGRGEVEQARQKYEEERESSNIENLDEDDDSVKSFGAIKVDGLSKGNSYKDFLQTSSQLQSINQFTSDFSDSNHSNILETENHSSRERDINRRFQRDRLDSVATSTSYGSF